MTTDATTAFAELVRVATGHEPYEYQAGLAVEGPPDVLDVPTGSGKTVAAVLPWLYRRRSHPDHDVRAATPARLVVVLPMRVLVEQTAGLVTQWLSRLRDDPQHRFDVSDVASFTIRGGDGKPDGAWRLRIGRETVVVGTLDMLLSRALNRGYAESRRVWPIDFGLLHSDTFWVYDEVQLMGPGLPTSRQLAAFRERIGSGAACASMWMSATVDQEALRTVDNPDVGRVRGLSATDVAGRLRQRLEAGKRVEAVEPYARRYERELAASLAQRHRPATRTIAVLNSVERAQAVAAALGQVATEADVVLLHARFRPGDRDRQLARALADPPPAGTIVVATQVVEAGVDVSAATMLIEAAPWPSVVQRAGRCNRGGDETDATLLWVRPPKAAPYEQADVDAAAQALVRLQGQVVTPRSMAAARVSVEEVVHPILRRRDLLELFDTAPDLSGEDVDVSRFIRDGDDVDVHVAWRVLPDGGPPPASAAPTRDELCPVPINAARRWLTKQDTIVAWRYDHQEGGWVPLRAAALRPGEVVLIDASAGGYVAHRGWDSSSRVPVSPVEPDEVDPLASPIESSADDATTFVGRWVPLVAHLADVEAEVRRLGGERWTGLLPSHVDAAAAAGRLHDLGKAHEVFQHTLLGDDPATEGAPPHGGPWAKSSGSGRRRHSRRHFRHELVSALALLGPGGALLEATADPDLVVYLVAAHHGVVRMAIRSLRDETPCPSGRATQVALGVCDGELFGPVSVPGGSLPAGPLDLSVMRLGANDDGSPSWSRRALGLRDRPDLGPFRLAALEALVRIADWRASRQDSGGAS